MTTLKETKAHFNQEGTKTIQNTGAGYLFCKRADGVMFQMQGAEIIRTYKTIEGLAKAALYRIKRG